ncbi:hypothetical protein JB92DRAFT_3100518 [Gautieria morchelliformis]|nr:hypothetical protein JB92DRAFT_3100518 [Gautieria morchelliformis]
MDGNWRKGKHPESEAVPWYIGMASPGPVLSPGQGEVGPLPRLSGRLSNHAHSQGRNKDVVEVNELTVCYYGTTARSSIEDMGIEAILFSLLIHSDDMDPISRAAADCRSWGAWFACWGIQERKNKSPTFTQQPNRMTPTAIVCFLFTTTSDPKNGQALSRESGATWWAVRSAAEELVSRSPQGAPWTRKEEAEFPVSHRNQSEFRMNSYFSPVRINDIHPALGSMVSGAFRASLPRNHLDSYFISSESKARGRRAYLLNLVI